MPAALFGARRRISSTQPLHRRAQVRHPVRRLGKFPRNGQTPQAARPSVAGHRRGTRGARPQQWPVTNNKNGGRRVQANTYRRVEGDDRPFDASALSAAFAGAAEQFWFGANYYRRTLPGDDLAGSWLVWDKRPSGWNDEGGGIDDVIGSGFELIWSRAKHQQRVMRHQWSGFTARNKEFDRAHPTEKPVALLADILERWTPPNGSVVDPFSGSATTLIAAEKTGRRCYAIEIDPGYVQVGIERWEAFTGEKAEKIA